MNKHEWLDEKDARIEVLKVENARLRSGFERYETARRMNPRQWADAWELNIRTGKPFDDIVDDLRPFLRPNASVKPPSGSEVGLNSLLGDTGDEA